jgi:hypothetical protein
MRLSRNKTQLVVNDLRWPVSRRRHSTIAWATVRPCTIIDRYRVSTDKHSGIINDPNRLDDPQYIMLLIDKRSPDRQSDHS